MCSLECHYSLRWLCGPTSDKRSRQSSLKLMLGHPNNNICTNKTQVTRTTAWCIVWIVSCLENIQRISSQTERKVKNFVISPIRGRRHDAIRRPKRYSFIFWSRQWLMLSQWKIRLCKCHMRSRSRHVFITITRDVVEAPCNFLLSSVRCDLSECLAVCRWATWSFLSQTIAPFSVFFSFLTVSAEK